MRSDRKSNCQRRRLTVELLEPRNLLSAASVFPAPPAASSLVASPLAVVLGSGSAAAAKSSTATNPTVVGYTPRQILAAYGFNLLTTFSTGSGSESANGAGQTIAIVDAYNDPNIASDLAVFDATFGIAAPPSFKIVSQTGTSKLPVTNPDWDTEISLDVEWAHAIAPGANILLVETTSDRWSDLIAGVDYAKNQPGVSVVSMSWDVPEYRIEAATDSTFTTAANHPVTFVAAAGDYGSPPEYPATSANVLAVGGTTLSLSSGGSYGSETAWSDGGGGVSTVEKEPAFQDGAQATGYRSAPDVSYDANPNSGFAVYDTIDDRYGTGWEEIGGTSAGAPQWSALLAITDEGLAAAGKPALAQAQARLYTLPANAFHDVTSGNNGTYATGVGYDAVTGLGSPVANVLIEDLINGTTGSPTGVSRLRTYNFGFQGGSAAIVNYTAVGPVYGQFASTAESEPMAGSYPLLPQFLGSASASQNSASSIAKSLVASPASFPTTTPASGDDSNDTGAQSPTDTSSDGAFDSTNDSTTGSATFAMPGPVDDSPDLSKAIDRLETVPDDYIPQPPIPHWGNPQPPGDGRSQIGSDAGALV
jgi:subtilase family serine protease